MSLVQSAELDRELRAGKCVRRLRAVNAAQTKRNSVALCVASGRHQVRIIWRDSLVRPIGANLPRFSDMESTSDQAFNGCTAAIANSRQPTGRRSGEPQQSQLGMGKLGVSVNLSWISIDLGPRAAKRRVSASWIIRNYHASAQR